jgi:hypothetical protein
MIEDAEMSYQFNKTCYNVIEFHIGISFDHFLTKYLNNQKA